MLQPEVVLFKVLDSKQVIFLFSLYPYGEGLIIRAVRYGSGHVPAAGFPFEGCL